MNISEKQKIIQAFLSQFESELTAIVQSAKAAHQAATHEESRAEDRHDTFAIEASYLAAGQAARHAELLKIIAEFTRYLAETTADKSSSLQPATEGNLVTLEHSGKQSLSFLASCAGGAQLNHGGKAISVVTPASPLGEVLFHSKEGDTIEVESKSGIREYRLTQID